MRYEWIPEHDEYLREAWLSATVAEIAIHLGFSQASVYSHAWRLGLPRRPVERRLIDEAKLTELWYTRKTVCQIGYELGFSGAHVSKEAKRIGLPSRAKKRSFLKRKIGTESGIYYNGFVSDRFCDYAVRAAAARGITVGSLIAKIINTVLNDEMIDAVLDDMDTKTYLTTPEAGRWPR